MKATDSKGEFVYKEFNIKVLNVNERPYGFKVLENEINEKSPAGTLAGEIEVPYILIFLGSYLHCCSSLLHRKVKFSLYKIKLN